MLALIGVLSSLAEEVGEGDNDPMRWKLGKVLRITRPGRGSSNCTLLAMSAAYIVRTYSDELVLKQPSSRIAGWVVTLADPCRLSVHPI